MVTAVSIITSCNGRQDSRSSEDTQRPPLAPSERDNAAPRRTKGREITSRYLSSRTPATSCRRTSPKVEGVRRVSVPPDLLTPKRPQSSERCQPATPPRAVAVTPSASVINAVKRASDVPWTSTRTLSVSFQGESFSPPPTKMCYLEVWTMLDRDHSSSLSGAIGALEASTLCLPLICCARADVQSLNEAVRSAVGAMQTMGSSICHLFPKVEGMNLVVSKLADVSAQEIAVLHECKGLILL